MNDTEPTTSLLESLEDLVDQLGREKMTEEQVMEIIHNISEFYKQTRW
jgi:hypothetical protein